MIFLENSMDFSMLSQIRNVFYWLPLVLINKNAFLLHPFLLDRTECWLLSLLSVLRRILALLSDENTCHHHFEISSVHRWHCPWEVPWPVFLPVKYKQNGELDTTFVFDQTLCACRDSSFLGNLTFFFLLKHEAFGSTSEAFNCVPNGPVWLPLTVTFRWAHFIASTAWGCH